VRKVAARLYAGFPARNPLRGRASCGGCTFKSPANTAGKYGRLSPSIKKLLLEKPFSPHVKSRTNMVKVPTE